MKRLSNELQSVILNWKKRNDDYGKIVKITKSHHKKSEFNITLEIKAKVIIEAQITQIHEKRSFQTMKQNENFRNDAADIENFTICTIELDKLFSQKVDKLIDSITQALFEDFF
jgi:hypothetical protein